ncbi:MAG: methyltransferase [Desulfurococcaceae archaeon]
MLLDLLKAWRGHHDICVDLGAGTGVLGAYASFHGICERVVLVDVNPLALENARANVIANKLEQRALVMGSSEFLRDEIADAVVANPPYLPGIPKDAYEEALLGGPEGWETVLYFVDEGRRLLKCGGTLYLVFSSLSRPWRVWERLREGFELVAERTKRYFYEELYGVIAKKICR